VLNRQVVSAELGARERLLDGVSALADLEVERDRFRFAPQRDANIVRMQGGVLTGDTKRIAGIVKLGYLRLTGVGAAMADSGGLVASVDEDIRLGGRARALLTGLRDIDFSFDPSFPYYTRVNGRAELLVEISSAWDARLVVEGERMTHRPAPALANSFASYADAYGFVGGRTLIRIAPGVRIGIDAGREERDSPVSGRGFIGYRSGVSMTVGTRPLRVRGGLPGGRN